MEQLRPILMEQIFGYTELQRIDKIYEAIKYLESELTTVKNLIAEKQEQLKLEKDKKRIESIKKDILALMT